MEKAQDDRPYSRLSPTVAAYSPTEQHKSNLETKLIHVEMAPIYLSGYVYMLFGLRKVKGNPYFAKGNPHTEAWASGVMNHRTES